MPGRDTLWLGPFGPVAAGWIKHPGPGEVSALLEIHAARRRHRRSRQHGHADVTTVMRVAVEVRDRTHGYLGRRQ